MELYIVVVAPLKSNAHIHVERDNLQMLPMSTVQHFGQRWFTVFEEGTCLLLPNTDTNAIKPSELL